MLAFCKCQRFTTTIDQRQCGYVYQVMGFVLDAAVPSVLIITFYDTCLVTIASFRFYLWLSTNLAEFACVVSYGFVKVTIWS